MLSVLTGVLGLLVGLLLGIWFERLNNKESKNLKAEHEAYKQDVEVHFEKTAQLAQQMAQNYRNMYAHLAEGAVTLCQPQDENKAPSLTALRRYLVQSPEAEATVEALEKAKAAEAEAVDMAEKDGSDEAHSATPENDTEVAGLNGDEPAKSQA